jgi:hypothetical protein
MREKLAISEERLRQCVQEHYAITPTSFDFLPLGLDFRKIFLMEGGMLEHARANAAHLLQAGEMPPTA